MTDERAGLALKFIQTPEDYYKWFRYVLQGTYGVRKLPKPDEDISVVNLLRFGGDSYDQSFCKVPEGEQIETDHTGRIMMDATKIVGMRLMIHNEATTEILGNSPFKLIQSEVRSHKRSYVDFDEIDDSHYDSDAWASYDSAT